VLADRSQRGSVCGLGRGVTPPVPSATGLAGNGNGRSIRSMSASCSTKQMGRLAPAGLDDGLVRPCAASGPLPMDRKRCRGCQTSRMAGT
jgi:hypothetical protein